MEFEPSISWISDDESKSLISKSKEGESLALTPAKSVAPTLVKHIRDMKKIRITSIFLILSPQLAQKRLAMNKTPNK